MGERGASRTAVLVCQGRAVAHGGLAVGRFDDPTALALLRDDERLRVERARADVPPKAWLQRMDVGLIRLQAESMAARTVAVDDAVRAAGRSKRLDQQTQRAALRTLLILDAADRLADLRVPPGNRLEKLKGDRANTYSIRINDQWRICFRWTTAGPEDVEIVDYH